MAEEIKTETTPEVEVDAEVTDNAPAESDDTEATEVETSETDDTTEEPQIDYKAIAEEERARREKAEKAAADANYKLRETKRTVSADDTPDGEPEDDKPLTRKEAMALFEQQQQEATKTSQETEVKRIIQENTSSEEEAEAAFLMYQNRTVPTGDPQADAMFAIGGLNVNRTKAIAEEVRRSAANKQNATTHSTSHQPEAATKDEPKLAPNDARAIKDAGMQWDGKKRLYVKPVGKRTMFFDPTRKEGDKSWIA